MLALFQLLVVASMALIRGDRTRQVKPMRSILTIAALLAILAGCDDEPLVNPAVDFATERAMAEIAIASVTTDRAPAPVDKPQVGDQCPQCNNPPGACGVGRVGDGRTCDPCRECGGDGRIDDRDLMMGPMPPEQTIPIEPIPDPLPDAEPVAQDNETQPTRKEIILHMTEATRRAWPSAWYSQDRESFQDAGWLVRAVMEPEEVTKVPFFDVIASDGEVFQFYQPITLDPKEPDKIDVSHLETR